MKILITENQFKLIIEEVNDNIIDFSGFSEPIFIPSYRIYLVKFKNTSTQEKNPQSEKIIFKNTSDGKTYVFDSEIVQKTGRSDFYINLDDLSKNYNIKFSEKLDNYKPKLTTEQKKELVHNSFREYMDGKKITRCKNQKCVDYTTKIDTILKTLYGKYYKPYKSYGCPTTSGYVDIYPFKNTEDKDGKSWSTLNYVKYISEILLSLLNHFIETHGYFEHSDFLNWIDEKKEKFFKGQFMENIVQTIKITNPSISTDVEKMIELKGLDLKLLSNFCPQMGDTSDKILIGKYKNKIIKIQYLRTSRISDLENGVLIKFSQKHGPQKLHKEVDYILTDKGTIIPNYKISIDKNGWFVPSN
jgi:hypothetical protein